MITMQQLSTLFERDHPGIHLDWVTLEENILREKTTTDAATHGGQYDIVTIGPLEAPIWGQRNWLLPLEDKLPPAYDLPDLLQPIRDAASADGHLYALPFYAESALTFYRKDLFAAAGLTMPAHPTYAEIEHFAQLLNNPAQGTAGICLRGKPGWGENMAVVTSLVNTFGGRWFDPAWQPQLDSPEWHTAVQFYVHLLQHYGPPGVSSNGFNESLTLFETGRCAMWIDATVAAGALTNPHESAVAATVGFAPAPTAVLTHGSPWLWFWGMAIPSSSRHAAAALTFLEWATSKQYIDLVAQTHGWAAIPPGTRRSTYQQSQYLALAPFADLTYHAILAADPLHPTREPVPYTGLQLVVLPAFPTIGNQVGQLMAAALVGQLTVDEALTRAQAATVRVANRMGLAPTNTASSTTGPAR